jgi:hypothetical protein
MQYFPISICSKSGLAGEPPFLLSLQPLSVDWDRAKRYESLAELSAELEQCGIDTHGLASIMTQLRRDSSVRSAAMLSADSVLRLRSNAATP